MKYLLILITFLYTTSIHAESSKGDIDAVKRLGQRANSYILKDTDSAIILFDEVIILAQKYNEHKVEGQARYGKGVCMRLKGKMYEAIQLMNQSLELFLYSRDTIKVTQIYGALASIYSDLNEHDLAVDYYLKSLKIYTEIKEYKNIYMIYNNLSKVFMNKLEWDSALMMSDSSLAVIKRHSAEVRKDSYASYCYGRSILLLEGYKEGVFSKSELYNATSYVKNSLSYYREEQSEYIVAFQEEHLGEIYLNLNEYDSSIFHLNKANSIFHSLKKEDFDFKLSLAKNFMDYYNVTQQKDSAYKWQSIYIPLLEKSIESKQKIEVGKELARAEFLYEKEKSDLLHKEAIQTEKAKWYSRLFFMSVMLFVLVILFILYFFYSKMRVQKRILQTEIMASENERKRISMELHDNIGQQILLLKSKVSEEITDDLDALLQNLRQTSRELYPLMLNSTGFSGSIIDLLSGVKEKLNYITTSEIPYEIDEALNEREKLNLYRIFQELINNTIKHASASAIKIEGSFNKKIAFAYLDNGNGNISEKNIGIGLQIIKQRIHEIGYAMYFDKTNAKGLKIIIQQK